MMMQKQQSARISAKAPSWMLTFADLLGIVLAIFVLIYASSDRQADVFTRAVMRLTDPLVTEQAKPLETIVSDVMTRQGYQIALLKKHIKTMPYWTLEEVDSETLRLHLNGKRLSNALSDGTWLDILDRFERDVTLTVYADDIVADSAAYLSAASLAQMRADRGLTRPWVIGVEQAGGDASLQAQITVHLGKTPAQRHFVSNAVSEETAVTVEGQ